MSRPIHPQTTCMYMYFWVTQVRKKEQKDKLASQTSNLDPVTRSQVYQAITSDKSSSPHPGIYIARLCLAQHIRPMMLLQNLQYLFIPSSQSTLPQTIKEIHVTVVPLIMLKHTCKTQPILETQRNIMQPTLARSCPKNRYLAWAFFMEVLASVFVYVCVCVCICTCRRV